MSRPATVAASTFARYQDKAIREKVIVVTSHDRVVGAYRSADELARYERLKARERTSHRTEDLPDHLVGALEAAQYGADPR